VSVKRASPEPTPPRLRPASRPEPEAPRRRPVPGFWTHMPPRCVQFAVLVYLGLLLAGAMRSESTPLEPALEIPSRAEHAMALRDADPRVQAALEARRLAQRERLIPRDPTAN